jgi:hypothetical protein
MFVLFCACDVMNVLSVKKNENLQKTKNKKKQKNWASQQTNKKDRSFFAIL